MLRLTFVLVTMCFLRLSAYGQPYPVADAFDFPVPEQTYVNNWYAGRCFSGCTYSDCSPPGNHLGEDIDLSVGTPIYAAASGRLVVYRPQSDPDEGYGQLVAVIEHRLSGQTVFINGDGEEIEEDTILTIYGHIRRYRTAPQQLLPLAEGMNVYVGDVIGYVNVSSHPDGQENDPNGDGLEHLHMGCRLMSKRTAQARDPDFWYRGYDDGGNPWRGDFGCYSQLIQSSLPRYCSHSVAEPNVLWHPSGSLIRTEASPSVYLLIASSAHPFLSETDFFSNRFAWSDVIFVSEQEMMGYCEVGNGPVPNRSDEALYRISDSDNPTRVWMKHRPQESSGYVMSPILTPGILKSYGFDWCEWDDVTSDDPLIQWPVVAPMNYREGSLIKGSQPAVYVMDQGYLRPIHNADVFEQLGLCWGNIITVSQSDLENRTGCLGIDSTHPVTQSVIQTPPNCADPLQPQVSVAYEGQASRIVHLAWSIVDNLSLYSLLLDFSPNSWITHSLITGNLLGSSRTEDASGQFDWQVPNEISGVGTVRVIGQDNAGNVAFEYTQDFYVDPPAEGVHITGPNYGQVYSCGGLAVQWTTTGYMTDMRVDINRAYPEGPWEALSYNAANNGFFAWLVTGPSTQRGRFKVTSNFDTTMWDISDQNIAIVSPDITYPNGTDVIVAGIGIYPITWTSEGFSQTPITIDLNRDYPDGQWEPVQQMIQNDGETFWDVTGPATNHARLRLVGGENWCIYDWSDADFTILAPELQLVSPTGEDTLIAGVPYNVTWTTNDLPGDVQISVRYFHNCSGADTQYVQEYTPNDGSETCIIQIPCNVGYPAAVSAFMEIRSLYYPAIYTESDSHFIVMTPGILLEQPWPTSVWHVGQIHTITWSHWYADSPVAIELNRTYPTGPWETLADSTENDGLFAWNVTGPNSESARIRISTLSYPFIADSTDGDFSITNVMQPGVLWERSYGGPDYDGCYTLDRTLDNGLILGGMSMRSNNNEHAWLVRSDNTGDTIWTRQFYTDYYDEARWVQTASDGGLIVAGHRRYRLWMARLNSDGDTLWTKQYGNYESGAVAYCVRELANGYALAGTSNQGMVLMELDGSGDTLWTRIYAGQTLNNAVSMIITVDGGYALAGGLGDFKILKTDHMGSVEWTRVIGSEALDYANSIEQTADGGYIVSGGYDARMALLKLDADGDSVWMHLYGAYSGNDSRGYGVIQAFDGGYVTTGLNFVPGDYQLYVVRTNSLGDTLWTRDLGGSNWDEGRSIIQLSTGEFVVAGITWSYGAGERDYYLLKLDADVPCDDWTPSAPHVVIHNQGGFPSLHWSSVDTSVAGCPEVVRWYEILASSTPDGEYSSIGRTVGTSTSFVDSTTAPQNSSRFYIVRARLGELD